jgi:electron transport complex protein RnfB
MSRRKEDPGLTRREFLRMGVRGGALLGAAAAAGGFAYAGRRGHTVWQIDPSKCIQCGNCATYCVLDPSAVKCVHSYEICHYCDRCFAYFQPLADETQEGAENQLCPTGAIRRKYVEGEEGGEKKFEYGIEEELCIGCGKCIQGCNASGLGAMYLQVRHDRCANCNHCAIAAACPADAFVRVPAGRPYLLKDEGKGT